MPPGCPHIVPCPLPVTYDAGVSPGTHVMTCHDMQARHSCAARRTSPAAQALHHDAQPSLVKKSDSWTCPVLFCFTAFCRPKEYKHVPTAPQGTVSSACTTAVTMGKNRQLDKRLECQGVRWQALPALAPGALGPTHLEQVHLGLAASSLC
jgi:hypothetical protein